MEVPRLDDDEYAVIAQLNRERLNARKEYRRQHGVPLSATPTDLYRPVLEAYERMTGCKETEPNAILHHVISQYGPPRPHCGRPYRTRTATKCYESGCPGRA
jgi:hypothetical protein